MIPEKIFILFYFRMDDDENIEDWITEQMEDLSRHLDAIVARTHIRRLRMNHIKTILIYIKDRFIMAKHF